MRIFILLLWLLELAMGIWRLFLATDKAGTIIIGSLAIWLLVSALMLSRGLVSALRQGAGGYNVKFWVESPVIGFVTSHGLNGTFYSNDPYPVAFFTHRN